ncbi:hypothetical protein AB0903_13275 [Streptomyces sp. NPDC048389]|uniref:hypothetical protein n=1 Tax=Streptomyces sp. NPDC048389 TaxID=3154622 RepID=UPI003453FD80
MTVPEENRRKTSTTDDVITRPEKIEDENRNKKETGRETPDASGRTMREAMEEAGVKPEDYES